MNPKTDQSLSAIVSALKENGAASGSTGRSMNLHPGPFAFKTPHGEPLVGVLGRTFRKLFDIEVDVVGTVRFDEGGCLGVSGIVGVAGPWRGAFFISFPPVLANELGARLLRRPPDSVLPEEDVVDGIAETANIVAGNLLPSLEEGRDTPTRLSLPSVVVGAHRVSFCRSSYMTDAVLAETPTGSFVAGLCLSHSETEDRALKSARRFLLVDDSRLMRVMLRKSLEEAGFDKGLFLEAGDGVEALQILEGSNWDVDLVFCDLRMPRMDGLQLLEEIQSRGHSETCPVIVVSGEASDDRGRAAVARGARGWVVKPFSEEALRRQIRRALT